MSLLTTISVRNTAGANVTSTWLGKRASSTQNAEKAVQDLAAKIDSLKHASVVYKGRSINAFGNPVELFEIWGKLPKAVRK